MKRYDIDDIDVRDPSFIARFADVLQPALWRYFRPVVHGLDRIPDGAALYVGNHNASLLSPDTFLFGISLFRHSGVEHLPYGLGHEIAISLPVIHQLLLPLGAVRASHANAGRIFGAGRKALVYPGSDYDAMRPYRDRNKVVFGPRRGYLRLALRHGVPIVPLVAAGAHETLLIIDDCRWLAQLLGAHRFLRLKAWPLALSIPWGLTLGPVPTHFPLPTRVFIEVLDPIHFERSGPEVAEDADYLEDCNRRVLDAMQPALERLAAERLATGGKILL